MQNKYICKVDSSRNIVNKKFQKKSSCVCLPDTLADQFIVPLDEIHAKGGHFPVIRYDLYII
jgi:hypothetical protein